MWCGYNIDLASMNNWAPSATKYKTNSAQLKQNSVPTYVCAFTYIFWLKGYTSRYVPWSCGTKNEATQWKGFTIFSVTHYPSPSSAGAHYWLWWWWWYHHHRFPSSPWKTAGMSRWGQGCCRRSPPSMVIGFWLWYNTMSAETGKRYILTCTSPRFTFNFVRSCMLTEWHCATLSACYSCVRWLNNMALHLLHATAVRANWMT